VLDAATTVEEGVVEVGYVAGRIGVGHARLESLTDDDAVIELDAAPCEKIDDWLGADVGDDEIGRQLLPISVSIESTWERPQKAATWSAGEASRRGRQRRSRLAFELRRFKGLEEAAGPVDECVTSRPM
jgi:hypothetical protein